MQKLLQNKSYIITNGYDKTNHPAIDIVGSGYSTDYVVAFDSGVVTEVRKDYRTNDKKGSSYGNYVKINHENGFYTLYSHLKYGSVCVGVGQRVNQGQVIGFMGNTGRASGIHTHFEIRTSSSPNSKIDPRPYLESGFVLAGTYQVYDNVKREWLPNVCINNMNEYAGNYGNPISGLYVDGKKYRVHDKVKNEWLPWVYSRDDYAGNLGNVIDGVQIYNATYRVKLKDGSYLSWINKVDDTPNGYAGIYGREIDAIQIKE